MSMATQSFRVSGRPRTKGSLQPRQHRSARGVKWTFHDSDLSVTWKKVMIAGIRKECGIKVAGKLLSNKLIFEPGPIEVPLYVHSSFFFDPEGEDDDGAHPWPTQINYGDEDKLRRNLLDAMTQSGLIKDDCLVLGGSNSKRWATETQPAGVVVSWIVASH